MKLKGSSRLRTLRSLLQERRCLKRSLELRQELRSTIGMGTLEPIVSPDQRVRRYMRIEEDTGSTEFSHRDVVNSSIPSVGNTDTTAACRVLEGRRVTPVPAMSFCFNWHKKVYFLIAI